MPLYNPAGSGGGSGTVTSVTAGDTSVVVGGTPTVAPTLTTATLDVIAADHPPAADWANNSKKITSLANGSSAQDAAAFGQIPVIDGTAGDIQPIGVQAAGSSAKTAAADHVHQGSTWLSLLIAPSGATAETFPRHVATSASGVPTSGTLQVVAIPLPKGLTVSSITMVTGAQAKTGGTHGWYVLLDSGLVVRAVTADQTDAATVWGATNTAYTLAVGTPYVTPSAGLYYLGVCVTMSAGQTPTFMTCTALATGAQGAPILGATSSTGQTTPPSLAATMGALTASSKPFYGYTS